MDSEFNAEINEKNIGAINDDQNIMIDDTDNKETAIVNSAIVPTVTKKKVIKDSTVVTIRAVVPEITYSTKESHLFFKLHEVGDTVDITFGELKEVRARYRGMLTKPWIIIEDPDVRQQFPELQKGYEKYMDVDDVSWLYRGTVSSALAKIENFPKAMHDILLTKVVDIQENNNISINAKILKALAEKFSIDINDLIK